MPTKTASVTVQPITQPVLPEIDQKLYEALRADIERRGILVPVIRDAATNEILDGKIRSKIAQEIGIRDVPTVFLGKLTANDRQEIRHGLNTYRRHLTRAQIQAAVEWAVRSTPGHSDRYIAGRVGVSHNTVAAARRRAVGQVDQLTSRTGKDGKSYASHKPSVYTATRGQTEVIRRGLVALGDDAPDGVLSTRKLRKLVGRKERAELIARSVSLPTEYKIENCDFRKHGIPAGTVDMVYVDPPWGGEWKQHRHDFARENYSILRDGGIAVCYFGQQMMLDWVEVFRSAGFNYRWMMAAVNDDAAGSSSVFGSLLTCWRPIVILQKGGKRLHAESMVSDVFRTQDRDKSYHNWQQSLTEAVHLIRGFSGNGATIADLTCCTGTSGVACAQIGSRKYLGVEIDEKLCKLARSRIDAELRK